MLEFCRKTKKNIYIYGYNQRSKIILSYLRKNNVKVKGIVVSDGQSKDQSADLEMFWISEIDGTDCALILAINYAWFNEIFPMIVKKCISELYFLNGMKLYAELQKYDDLFNNGYGNKETMYLDYKQSYNNSLKIFEFLLEKGVKIESAIDIGGGTGAWLKALKDLNNSRILTVDNSVFNRSGIIEENEFLKCDIKTMDIDKIIDRFGRFDIAISIETAEHIDENYAERFIDILCIASDVILFSAAIRFQGGNGHVNEQRQSYWVNLFKKKDYVAIDCIRPHFWEDKDIHYHYKENCILYVKSHLAQRFIEIFGSSLMPIDVVHPDLLEKKMTMFQEGWLY